MAIKQRLILAVVFLWLSAIIFCLGSGGGVFFSQMSNGTTELYSLEASAMQKNMPVNGECYVVYELIASSVTEETSKYTGKTTETTNAYYYAIPMGDDDHCMLLKTKANSEMTSSADLELDLFWDDNSTIDDLFDHAFKVDGILVNNDPEIVGFYDEWVAEFEDDEGMTLAPYTLDCTKTVSTRIKEFWAGSVLLVALLGVVVFLIFSYFSKKHQPSSVPVYSPSSPTYGNDYTNLSNQTTNRYDPTTTFSSNSLSGVSNNFQAQGSPVNTESAYGQNSSGDFFGQQSSLDTYVRQSGFAAQNGSTSNGYDTYSSYQSQGGYTQQNGFRAQSGSAYPGGDEQGYSDSYPSQNGFGNNYGSGYGNDDYDSRF